MAAVDRCRAKGGRATCPKHGNPEVVARQEFMTGMGFAPAKVVNPPIRNGVVRQAVDSPLLWDGVKPAWWAAYREELMNHPASPSEPKLIDVIDSPAGPLAVVWQDECYKKGDLNLSFDSGIGLQVCYYKSMESGEILGYIKMASMTDASFERSFGNDEFTPFRVRSRFGGSIYPFRDRYDDPDSPVVPGGQRNLSGEELRLKRRAVWAVAHNDFEVSVVKEDGSTVFHWDVSESDAPSDDREVEKSLKVLARKADKWVQEKRAYHATPYVDFSRVESPLTGKGFGSALYVYTARMLAKQGKVLRGSGIQSDSAQGAWGRFKEAFPEQLKSMTLTDEGKKSKAPVLDFRG